MSRKLMDEDGENRAVRCFLMVYGTPGLTTDSMKQHMTACGFKDHWPDWVNKSPISHLTKGGAQHWLRHLFSLENNVLDKVDLKNKSLSEQSSPIDHSVPESEDVSYLNCAHDWEPESCENGWRETCLKCGTKQYGSGQ